MTKSGLTTLEVMADGGLSLYGEAITDAVLPARLKAIQQEDSDCVLKLGGDGAVPYKRIAEVLALARQSGVKRIAFVTQTP